MTTVCEMDAGGADASRKETLQLWLAADQATLSAMTVHYIRSIPRDNAHVMNCLSGSSSLSRMRTGSMHARGLAHACVGSKVFERPDRLNHRCGRPA